MHVRDPRFWLCFFMLAGGVAPVSAATLNVTAAGIDAADCGSKTAPCRSISRAIFNAAAGDKILVGPGRYGDLDADGTFGEAGEENANGALVEIDKPLTIESVEGAATTVIDGGNANRTIVGISANDVRFGKAKKGFTLARSGSFGVLVGVDVTGAFVSGIRAVGTRTGFASKAAGLVLKGDVAEASAQNAFVVTGNGSTITGCRATGNRLVGFSIGGTGTVLKGNVATANGDAGFDLAGSGHVVTGSVAAGNLIGVRVGAATGLTLTGNSILGNVESGVVVTAPDVTLTKSNIFGNDSGGGNCGVTTVGAGSVTLDKVCFGAPTGPGDDPADQVCGVIQILEIIEKVLKIVPKVPL